MWARLASCLALIALALVPAPAARQSGGAPTTAVDRWDPVRTTIRQMLTNSNAPSISVAVAKDGKIIWEESFGWANREKQIPATPHTMYSLASISKPITATGLMTLVEAGRVDLDKPANDYLGTGKLTGLAGDASAATVRRVMSHTAGLPLHYQFYYANNSYPAVTNDETIARYGILVNPPGAVYEYSNLGFGIIDHVIARTSGVDYADFMRGRVFGPLELTRTSVGIGPGLEPFAAERYDASRRPIPFYDFDHRGASAIYSSAHDLVRFGMFHLKDHLADQRPILKDATIDLMQQPVPPAQYGLGWGVAADDNGFRRVAHNGGMPGVSTELRLFPAEHLAIVAMTNGVGANLNRVVTDITGIVLPKFEDTRRQRAAPPAAPAPPLPPALPSADLTGEWTGILRTWERTVPMSMTFQPNGDVHVRIGNDLRALVNDAVRRDNNLRGRFAGTIPTSDARRWPHSVLLNLRLRNGTLSGMATAQTTADPVFFALTSYASLTKTK